MELPNWTKIRQERLSVLEEAVLPPDVKLPILPRAITEFTEKAASESADPKELAHIVESDAGLTCELLRVVNSAATGLRRQVSSVSHALNLLGIRKAGLLLTTTAVKSAMSSRKSKLINFQLFWNANYERALFARDLAAAMKTEPELAFAGTMLQDFLLPLLTSEMVDGYVDFSDRGPKENVRLVDFERSTWGWDHALAAGQIMVHWKFPDDLICCALYHHAGLEILADERLGRTAVAAVAIAGLLPDFFHQVPQGFKLLQKLNTAWPGFQLAERLKRVADQFEEARLAGSDRHVTFFQCYEKKRAAVAD